MTKYEIAHIKQMKIQNILLTTIMGTLAMGSSMSEDDKVELLEETNKSIDSLEEE